MANVIILEWGKQLNIKYQMILTQKKPVSADMLPICDPGFQNQSQVVAQVYLWHIWAKII